MDNDVSAGSAPSTSTSALGHLALGLTLLAFGLGHTGVISGVSAADAVTLALYVGGVALFVAGLLEFRSGSALTGTAFAGLGAFWFTWGTAFGDHASAHAAGLFLALWALLALTLTLAAKSAGALVQGAYGLLCVALILLAVAEFAGTSGIGKAGGWFAAVSGLVAWYAAASALAKWPTALPGRGARTARRGATAAG
ncbi:acetate uptake transporter [Streptomyces sp. NRRL F-5126]|uniref:acetate uptake transporter n=1 Tax=Streptomyces sp. NRRL F-5126 TaxID=1463857 RepID=UPI0004CADC91|nr:GPR1/FUN34/YaaH family transporter [Streptomyces sp. NRRL F-5126]